MKWNAINLPWLLAAPDDFRQRCKEVDKLGEARENFLRYLANFSLDINQLTRLAKSIGAARQQSDLKNLDAVTIGLVGNSTNSLLLPALTASALRHGINLEIIEAPFNQGVQWALDINSPLHTSKPDAVLLAFDRHIIPMTSEHPVGVAHSQIETIRNGLSKGCAAPLIVQTLPHPPETILGSFDARRSNSLRAIIDQFNRTLIEGLETTPDILFDVAGIAQLVGLENWHDEGAFYLAKLSFAQTAVPLYADHLARLLGALRGKSKKCLVLDLDNTLWGGVIGDDGIEGIILGQGNPTGEAYLQIQQLALELRQLGIILAVSSKNNDAIARTPFQEHPDMVLREDDIAVFQANWSDKASNLRAIAETLNIATDALVFVDDNPVERAQIRGALPEVAVPELPEDPSLYRRTILAAGYFETVALSDEDFKRADQYQANARRAELSNQSGDLSDFLTSLNMKIEFGPFDEAGRIRIAQLTNKSNQFNLTTYRYTEANIAEFQNDVDIFTLQVRLTDIFGDNGMISVIVCKQDQSNWLIDTWLMSCRVLGRRVEEAVLSELVGEAKKRGITGLIGTYIPSGRNDLVQDHYAKLGFQQSPYNNGNSNGEEAWALDTKSFFKPELPMMVKYSTSAQNK